MPFKESFEHITDYIGKDQGSLCGHSLVGRSLVKEFNRQTGELMVDSAHFEMKCEGEQEKPYPYPLFISIQNNSLKSTSMLSLA